MYAVLFEVYPSSDGKAEYLEIAEKVREFVETQEGFISIERFQSLADKGKVLSLSFWESEAAIETWRKLLEHRTAQRAGKEKLFHSYRIRVAQVVRDYADAKRSEAPIDSNDALM